MAGQPRISYVQPAQMNDPAMLAELERCRRGHAASREPGGARACTGDVLVVRQFLARRLPYRRRRPHHQGAVPHLRVALGAVRVLRQPALDQGGESRPRRRRLLRPDQFRNRRTNYDEQAEGRARLRRSDHLGPAADRRILGAAAQALQRARAGRDRLFRRHHDGPAALAADPQHRAPSDARRAGRLDGAGLRDDRTSCTTPSRPTDYWAKRSSARPQNAGRRVAAAADGGETRERAGQRRRAHPRARPRQALRRARGLPQHRSRRRRARDRRDCRPVRLRQDHAAALHRRPDAARRPARSASAIRASPSRLAGVAMVFQHFGLFPWKTVSDNVAYGLRMAGATKAEIARKVPEFVKLVGLPVSRTRFRIRCRAACSSAAAWPARSPSSRACC